MCERERKRERVKGVEGKREGKGERERERGEDWCMVGTKRCVFILLLSFSWRQS